jgi:hypothetical protein
LKRTQSFKANSQKQLTLVLPPSTAPKNAPHQGLFFGQSLASHIQLHPSFSQFVTTHLALKPMANETSGVLGTPDAMGDMD